MNYKTFYLGTIVLIALCVTAWIVRTTNPAGSVGSTFGGGADQTFCSHIATSTIVLLGPDESRMVMGTSSRQTAYVTATTTPVWLKFNFRPDGNGQGILVAASTTAELNDINRWEGAIYGRAYASTSVYVVDCDNARP